MCTNAEEKGKILVCVCCSIWDVEQGVKVTSLQENCTYSTAKITAAEFINPHDISFLLLGSGLVSIVTCSC